MFNHILRSAFACVCLVASLLRSYGQELRSSRNPALPVHWGSGEGLHSSVNPQAWMDDNPIHSSEKARQEGGGLKEPVIPTANLDVQASGESKSQIGTLYETGLATYYSAKAHGRMMASGERYDKNGFFCAHKKLPFGTKLRVVNTKNGKEVIVAVKDRGPFAKGRIIDLSNKAAEALGMLSTGVVSVELWIVE